MASEDIVKLEFPEHIRKRPGMYVGETSEASVLLREVIDNSIDELYYAIDHKTSTKSNTIWIEIQNTKIDGVACRSYLVADNGRGIPIKESAEPGVTMARLAVSSLAAGSKFAKNSMAIGMNGCGEACVNALSSRFKIMSRLKTQDLTTIPKNLILPEEIKDTTYYFCSFKEGVLTEEGFTDFQRDGFGGEYPSTIAMFTPDLSIYKSSVARIPGALSYVKFILDSLGHKSHIYVNGEEYKDCYSGFGMDIKCTLTSPEDSKVNPKVTYLISCGFQERLEPCEIVGSVNGLDCRSGVHVKWVQNSFHKAFSDMFSDCNRAEFMGIKLGIIILCNEPSFSSQTKERLADVDGFRASGREEIESLATQFKILFKNNYEKFKVHEAKILEYLKSTEKIGRKELIKSTVLIAADTSRPDAFVPNKLIDCSTTNRSEAELYIVEGNSAGGSLVKCRDPKIHAILPLRGKPKNTVTSEIEEVLSNSEMKDLISAIGVGTNDYHNMSEVRYGKVIITADADSDGKHINALCLGALATHLTFLIEAGCVFVAEPPLFEQDGKYYFEESQLNKKKHFGRFKGLGECDPEDLEPFVFNKDSRHLLQITMDNWEEARELMISSSAKRQVMVNKSIISNIMVSISEVK